MYSFKNDYSEGAHENIIEALARESRRQNGAYGNDCHSLHAAEMVRDAIGQPNAQVHFLAGGTQTNLTAISSFLRPHEAAVAAQTGHINVHETGAIEATGHKVVTAHTTDGKLNPELVQSVLDAHPDEHMVKPKLVYISDSTEVGTIYTKQELTALSKFCRENKLYLYLDGARLGCALTSSQNDVTLRDLGELTDAFYIGGTKNGALLGEALVICNPVLQEDFRYLIKQNGAMLAKGMVVGIQFEELFRDNLFFALARHANTLAEQLSQAITKAGFRFLADSVTNQIFPIFPQSVIEKLNEKYEFEIWSKIDENHTAIRLVTSWATTETAVQNFISDLQNCLN